MRAVIFDLDGVVVDTAKYHYLAWRKLAAELGFVFDEANNERLKGVSRMTSLEIVLETGKIQNLSMEEKIALADRKNGYYLDMVSTIDAVSYTHLVYYWQQPWFPPLQQAAEAAEAAKKKRKVTAKAVR